MSFAKDAICPYVTSLFNAILKVGYVPSVFPVGCITPIWKKKGSKKDPTKYRGITVSSTVGKLFEDIIASRINDVFEDQQCDLQFGFTSETAILCACLILTEAVNRSSRKHQTVATFLDAEKAFDVVWKDGLLRKFALLPIPADIWLIVISLKGLYLTHSWPGVNM